MSCLGEMEFETRHTMLNGISGDSGLIWPRSEKVLASIFHSVSTLRGIGPNNGFERCVQWNGGMSGQNIRLLPAENTAGRTPSGPLWLARDAVTPLAPGQLSRPMPADGGKRRHECRRGRQECLRHVKTKKEFSVPSASTSTRQAGVPAPRQGSRAPGRDGSPGRILTSPEKLTNRPRWCSDRGR
jgi:hypothetical protein